MTDHQRDTSNKLARAATLGAMLIGVPAITGCISNPDCGVCDPNRLVLESISGINYANRKVHLLTPGVDEGEYFVEDIGACVGTDEAQDATRGPEEWCKLSPLVTWQGLEFVFNNLLEPSSIELLRRDPSDPDLFEVYDWKTQIAEIQGPITRFNGDYTKQVDDSSGLMTRAINLTCVDNLRAQGVDFNHEVLDADPDICVGFHVDPQVGGGGKIPLKMQAMGTTQATRGETDWRGVSCTAPDSGPDTCCSACDYELSINVAKYGVDEGGTRRSPANAIGCVPGVNVYEECDGFITSVKREAETRRYSYEWGGAIDSHRLPLSDKIRETHPDDRPSGVEPDGVPCHSDADCDARFGSDSGAACVGVTPEGISCEASAPGCAEGHCKAQWFVTCKDDAANTGGAWCVDSRFKDKGAGACMLATAAFQACEPDPINTCTTWPAGSRLARCDTSEYPDGQLAASECCQVALGSSTDGAGCDPLFQAQLAPVPRFDRDQTLPEETRECFCGDPQGQHPACAAQIQSMCTPPWGELERHDHSSNEGQYTTRFVSKVGGVIYDPALKGVLYLPADRGNQPRALVEQCAEQASNPKLIGGRNIQDGWRMHDDDPAFETLENFDRALCSASEYHVVFAGEGERVRDKAGNELSSGDLSYRFETPEFHVVPGSGFPTDDLRIGACDALEISLSNKYDLEPKNLEKIEIWQIRPKEGVDPSGEPCATSLAPECWTQDQLVAGGRGCVDDPLLVSEDTPPCLVVDVSRQSVGVVRVKADSIRFNTSMFHLGEDSDYDTHPRYGYELSGRYRVVIPGLEQVERFAELDLEDPAQIAAYEAAFHDVCGMPLVTKGGHDYADSYYDFTIDEPLCKDDVDGDAVQLSCDNAREHFNPLQGDQDHDGLGDVADLCQLTSGETDAVSDSDKDGIGNGCDSCREPANNYNVNLALIEDPRLWVRNVPFQLDFDHDGVGDVCDNCVTVANCGVFDESNPHTVGAPAPYGDSSACQTDADADMIGDLCVNPDTEAPIHDLGHAAGPVGFGPSDDFDQDGVVNLDDSCPRQPLASDYAARVECTSDADCVEHSACAPTPATNGARYCDHVDSDDDQVGDLCDTCPFSPNPLQVTDTGMQLDDEDGDFVGFECELDEACAQRKDPRPYAFMAVAVEGQCCTTTYPGDGHYVELEGGAWGCQGLCDPDGFPVTRACADEAVPGEDQPDGSKCRRSPLALGAPPGLLELPPGCAEALDTAGLCAPTAANGFDCSDFAPEQRNRRLSLVDVGDEDQLWDMMCFLPQWDQDFDGIGDSCDLCPFAYDPFNEPIELSPTQDPLGFGRFCTGKYGPDALCADQEAGE